MAETINLDNGTGSNSAFLVTDPLYGIKIEASEDFFGLSGTLMDSGGSFDNIDRVLVTDENQNTIAEKQSATTYSGGDTITFDEVSVNAGETIYLMISTSADNLAYLVNTSPTFPYSGTIASVTAGWDDGSDTTGSLFAWNQITVGLTSAPGAPENTTQQVIGDDEIAIDWDAPSTGGGPSEYDLEVSEDGGPYTSVATIVAASTQYTYAADPATNEHRFRVRAENSAGASNYASTATVATDPRDLSVTGVASREISLSWDGARDATGYEVLRSESPGATAADYTAVDTVSGTTDTDTGLEDGEKYYYGVRATYPGTPSQVSNEVTDTTPLPATDFDTVEEI